MTTLSTNYSPCIERNSSNVQAGLYLVVRNWFKTLALKEKVNQERRQLLEMTDTMLSDIGITQAQANAEAYRVDLPVERLNILQQGRC